MGGMGNEHMTAYPKPHSSEWFKALEAFDIVQAAHSRKIIDLAGKTDVCTICGDDPASDYKLVHPKPHKDAVATIRLCDDCRLIREQNGESFLPF
jgi:hypothetical protein